MSASIDFTSFNRYRDNALEDGRSLYDTFHTEWTLLALGATDPATDGFKNAAQSMGIDLKVVRLPAQQLLELYESPLVLIRPDQIVAWRGASDEDGQQVLSLALGIHRIT